MNKYQKRLHKEIKEATNNSGLRYKEARKTFKWLVKYEPFSPCEDCDNRYCKRVMNKIVYCKDNR